jgi:hemoglobin
MNPNIPSLYERIGGRERLAILLRHFYADVRQHRLLGPVFNRHIHDWPAHLAKIGEFWSRLTGGPSNFIGSLPHKHEPLGIDARHFDTWLELWEANCRCYLAPCEALELSELAQMIGRRLQSIVVAETQPEPQSPAVEPQVLLRPV